MRFHVTLLAALLCAACGESTPATTTAVEPAAAHAAEGKGAGEDGHDCTEGAGKGVANDQVTTTTTPDGKTLQAAGAPLAVATVTPVAEILADPARFSGTTVRLKGNVSAMCTHARGWFAVATDDATGAYVRAITAPNFLVPADAVGSVAEVEGVVELRDVDAKMASHLAEGHKLDAPQGKVQQAILRATGATFTR